MIQGDWVNQQVTKRANAESVVMVLIGEEDHPDGEACDGCGGVRQGR